ncbi:hypothetical protein EO98_04350 [Methanosarcina sp. 2.H.T.1A.6]|uniref:hypothetical protein n=1 Tax=unclassified Methanosarcina TaxID=2644672 RepID=UPI00062233ED|nr:MULTISPECIES: hypothetical protein [unclassified Methanosarcina]KKG16333.1 hypothetical protein EO94_13515 [Methanosarcina sp. 2.H.T.1A.3]KKG19501.1 hypothetical protein EO98_04350 [Methanosarcina sp. 2.H.T.1A.6]KKG21806.1 hypothetical protein EO96_10370 [Methanosarcina sp. 2.H.T.1A.8]KKG26874.1 hypothetical protein EO97_03295 [Methanosarcina sp. 2.H.T.1A.15]
MNSLKDLKTDGLKELRENGLKGLGVRSLKDLILKPKTADVNLEDMEDLTKSRDQVKKKIIKLIKEKKEIEARIDLIRKAEKEKNEEIQEISEFPWREEIFPPLPGKVRVKTSGPLEIKNDSLPAKDAGFTEVKVSGMEIEVKGIDEKSEDKKPEDKKPDGKISEDIIHDTSQTTIVNAEEAAPKSGAGEKNEGKTFPEKAEKIKTTDLFSIEEVNENKVSSGNSGESSIEKSKPESKNDPEASLFGDSLIEELLNSEDLNPEEEQGFMKYLEEQEVGELITDLKNIRALLVRAEHAG